jgi:hypothetical protein
MKIGEGIKPGQKNVLPEWIERKRLREKEKFPKFGIALLQMSAYWVMAYRHQPYPPLWLSILMAVCTILLVVFIAANLYSYYKEFIRGNQA